MKAIEKQIAARLLANGEISEGDLEKALGRHTGRKPLQDLLVERGYVSRRAITRAIAEVNSLEFVDISTTQCDENLIGLLEPRDAWSARALPIEFDGKSLLVAMANPNDVYAQDNLRLRLGCEIRVAIAEKGELEARLETHYGPEDEAPARSGSRSVEEISTRLSRAIEKPNLDEPAEEENGVESHREYQRRVRQMRSSGEVRRSISDLETIIEDEPQETTASERETRNLGRRTGPVYLEPPATAAQDTETDPHDTPAEMELGHILRRAMELRAHDIEFTPVEKCVGVRFRTTAQWRPLGIYPISQHDQMITNLLKAVGYGGKDWRDISPGREMNLETPLGEASCRLQFQKTEDGPRIVVRFPDHLPLLRNPLLSLGLPADTASAINRRLRNRSGGLLILSSPNLRTVDHIYTSILSSLGSAGGADVLSLESIQLRRLSGITSIHCTSEEALKMDLENAELMNPDVIGIQTISSAEILKEAIGVSVAGTAVVGGYTAPDAKTAQQSFEAAGIDMMNFTRAVIGQLHVEMARKLCAACQQQIENRDLLPEWAKSLEADFYHAAGCEACNGTGYKGVVYLVDFFAPNWKSETGYFDHVVDRKDTLLAAAIAGEVDPREYAVS